MPDNDVILHVGYPKAASTWLQNRVFREEYGFQIPWPTHENAAIEYFVLQSKPQFDANAVRESFFKACKLGGGAPVISHEALIGDPVAGRYAGFETAERLAATFPAAKAIIYFRSQQAYAYSAWVEHVRRGGLTSIEAYLSVENAPPGYRPFCPHEFLKYDELIGFYADLFGREHIFALPMEAIASGQALDLMAAFLNNDQIRDSDVAPVYPGLQGASVRLLRWLNRFSPYDPAQRSDRRFLMNQIFRVNRRLPQSLHDKCRRADKRKVAELLGGRFAASNRRLQALTPVDISKFGYEL